MGFWGKIAMVTGIAGMTFGGAGVIAGAVLVGIGATTTIEQSTTYKTTDGQVKQFNYNVGVGSCNFGNMDYSFPADMPVEQQNQIKNNLDAQSSQLEKQGFWDAANNAEKSKDEDSKRLDLTINSLNQKNTELNKVNESINKSSADKKTIMDKKLALEKQLASMQPEDPARNEIQKQIDTCMQEITTLDTQLKDLNTQRVMLETEITNLNIDRDAIQLRWQMSSKVLDARTETLAGAILLPLFFLILAGGLAIYIINLKMAF